MKKIIFGLLLFSFCSCELLDGDEKKSLIPGTWFRHYRDEYTDTYDTIFITRASGDNYLVIKRSSYKKINDQKLWVTGSGTKKWMGSYNKNTGALFLTPTGKQIYFGPEMGELRLGTEPYKKLEQ